MSAIKHIQQKIMDITKERIMNTQKVSVKSQMKWVSNTRNISHVGSKKMEGCTPDEYRNEIIKQAIN